MTDAWGATTTTKQDVFGRAVETIAPTGVREVTEYDDIQNTVTKGLTTTGSLTDAEVYSTQQWMRRVVSRTRLGHGKITNRCCLPSHVFDGFGRETTATDGVTDTSVEFDVFGNPVTTTVNPMVAGTSGDSS